MVPIKFLEESFYAVPADCQFLAADTDAKTILPLIVIDKNKSDAFAPSPLPLAVHLLVLPRLGQQAIFGQGQSRRLRQRQRHGSDYG